MGLFSVPEANTGIEWGHNLNLNDVGAFISIWALVVMPSDCHRVRGLGLPLYEWRRRQPHRGGRAYLRYKSTSLILASTLFASRIDFYVIKIRRTNAPIVLAPIFPSNHHVVYASHKPEVCLI